MTARLFAVVASYVQGEVGDCRAVYGDFAPAVEELQDRWRHPFLRHPHTSPGTTGYSNAANAACCLSTNRLALRLLLDLDEYNMVPHSHVHHCS